MLSPETTKQKTTATTIKQQQHTTNNKKLKSKKQKQTELFWNLMFSVCKLQPVWGYIFPDYITVILIIYVFAGCPSYEHFESSPDCVPSLHVGGHKEMKETNISNRIHSAAHDTWREPRQTKKKGDAKRQEETRAAVEEAEGRAVESDGTDTAGSGIWRQQQGSIRTTTAWLSVALRPQKP